MSDIWIDERGEVMINPNVDSIYLPKEMYDGLAEFVSNEIDKEILQSLSIMEERFTHTE